ncbi:MAG TPA: alkaline phosphatase family protein [Candidatus Paceibacterota bacterium]|nr:alkaline phosphatase family protein [Candidatus Paceibacterota bacterium]
MILDSSISAQMVQHVIHISMDGLRPDAITALGTNDVPNFYRFRREGAFTDNARTDPDWAVTLPNHACQLTGRPVGGLAGHNWTQNQDPSKGETLESNKGFYIAGVFDVAHDNGKRTGLFASKSKFSLFATSWDVDHGCPDLIPLDYGKNKIDAFVIEADTQLMLTLFGSEMAAQPFDYVFLHFADPDFAGHTFGWDVTPGSPYLQVVKAMDARLGTVFEIIETNSFLAGRTMVLLTVDHGGSGMDHSNPEAYENFTIPFYVWGPGTASGADLYAINRTTRADPGTNRPLNDASVQPIRNGDIANLGLRLLGLPPVPGSCINASQELMVSYDPRPELRITLVGTNLVLNFRTQTNVMYDLEVTDDLGSKQWMKSMVNLSGTGVETNINVGSAAALGRFYRCSVRY